MELVLVVGAAHDVRDRGIGITTPPGVADDNFVHLHEVVALVAVEDEIQFTHVLEGPIRRFDEDLNEIKDAQVAFAVRARENEV